MEKGVAEHTPQPVHPLLLHRGREAGGETAKPRVRRHPAGSQRAECGSRLPLSPRCPSHPTGGWRPWGGWDCLPCWSQGERLENSLAWDRPGCGAHLALSLGRDEVSAVWQTSSRNEHYPHSQKVRGIQLPPPQTSAHIFLTSVNGTEVLVLFWLQWVFTCPRA